MGFTPGHQGGLTVATLGNAASSITKWHTLSRAPSRIEGISKCTVLHIQVKADEQAAKAAADYAQAQAEAQAELHRQLQQRLADAQAAAAAQEAEKEKRRAQPVTLKGARLAFNAPKAPAKPAATPPAGTGLPQDAYLTFSI